MIIWLSKYECFIDLLIDFCYIFRSIMFSSVMVVNNSQWKTFHLLSFFLVYMKIVMTPLCHQEKIKTNGIHVVCLCVLANVRIFIHMDTSLLPGKGCNFWLILGTHGHWAVRVPILACYNYYVCNLLFSSSHYTYFGYRAFSSGAVTNCFLGLKSIAAKIHPASRMWNRCS